MMEYDMKRNGSGYYDETAVKTGLFAGPQAGEIWKNTYGKEYLVLKTHKGGYCTSLVLRDDARNDSIEVISKTVKHTNPAMVSYVFGNELTEFVKSISTEQYTAIMETVGDRLGVTIKVSRDEQERQEKHEWQGERDALRHELDIVRKELEQKDADAKALTGATATLQEQLARAQVYETMYNALVDKLIEARK